MTKQTKKTNKLQAILQILLLTFLILSWKGGSILPASEEEPGKFILRVGYTSTISQLPIVLSYDANWLTSQKLAVELSHFQSYTALEAAFRANAIDLAYLPLPVAIKMKADAIAFSILGSLHQGGSRLYLPAPPLNSSTTGLVIGVPGLFSNEHLELVRLMKKLGVRLGTGYKTIGVQINSALSGIKNGRIDGFYLPQPYPSIAAHIHSSSEKMVETNSSPEQDPPSSVLVVHNRFINREFRQATTVYIENLTRACSLLQKDISEYGGNQTAITQEKYMGFRIEDILIALQNCMPNLIFKFSHIDKTQISQVMSEMLNMKLLLISIDPEELESINLNSIAPSA